MLIRTLGILTLLVVTPVLHAQEKTYVFGTSTDLTTGSMNDVRNSVGPLETNRPMRLFYSLYPSIRMNSNSANSTLNASYTLGIERQYTDTPLNLQSHSATAIFSKPLSPSWRISLSDSFQSTTDATSFNGLRGVTTAPQDPQFVFYPVAARISSRGNSASLVADYSIDSKSAVKFTGAHSLRNYGQNALSGSLSNQQVVSAGAAYKLQTGTHESWTLGYTGSFYNFTNFQNASSQAGQAGYSNQISRDTNLQLTVGVSRVKSLATGDTYIGYTTSAAVQKRIERNSLSVHYAQTVGDPSGLGSTSDTRRGGVSVQRTFATAAANLFFDVSAFDTSGTLDNLLQTRGYAATVSLGRQVTRQLSISSGAEYQRYTGAAAFAFTQKRIFISLRFNEPSFWRF